MNIKQRMAADAYRLAKNLGKAVIAGALMALPVATIADAAPLAVVVSFATGFFGWLAVIYDVRPGMLNTKKDEESE